MATPREARDLGPGEVIPVSSIAQTGILWEAAHAALPLGRAIQLHGIQTRGEVEVISVSDDSIAIAGPWVEGQDILECPQRSSSRQRIYILLREHYQQVSLDSGVQVQDSEDCSIRREAIPQVERYGALVGMTLERIITNPSQSIRDALRRAP